MRPVVGCAIGDGALMGARALLQAGLAIPPGTIVVMRPDDGLSRLDDVGLARAGMRWGDRQKDL